MKNFKLLLIAFFAVLFTSCDKENNDPTTPTPPQFKGELTTTSSEDVKFITENALFDITFNEDNNTANIVMNEISFTDKMPAQTMKIENAAYTVVDGKIIIGTAETIPSIGGRPYDDYQITRLQSTIAKDSIMLEFACEDHAVSYKAAKSLGEIPVLNNSATTEQSYSGNLEMISPSNKSTTTKDIVFETVIYDKIKQMDITMNGIKFSPMMPNIPMIIKWVNMKTEGETTTFSGKIFTPFVFGAAFPKYSFTNVSGTIKGNTLTAEMKVSGFTVKYSGTVK